MKNILIIGGSYFAGKILVEELVKEKELNIFIYNRGNRPLNKDSVTELVGDRSDKTRIKEVIPPNNWDAVIDFCAYTPEDIETMIDAIPGQVNHYIYISTTTIYEDTVDLPVEENALTLSGPNPQLGQYSDYGYNKWLAECKLKEKCKAKQIPYTVLRPAIIYGEYNYAPRESYFFDLIQNDKTLILPDNELPLFSFVYVVDVANIIKKSISNDKVYNETFNIAAKEMISYKRLIEVFRKITGKTITTKRMNAAMIDKKGIPLPFPLDHHLLYSGDKISRVLDFTYTPFTIGMKNTYEYYQLTLNR